ncbi:MAG: sulfatase family protein [Planctomycetota bacterium]|jgi:arylsulfatase A-like enzyme
MRTNPTRRQFLKDFTIGLAAVSFTDRLLAQSVRTREPNLLFVFPDQMRGQALGFMNEDPVITPNLDKFAAESLVLTEAVSNYPVCSPFRAMLMTGRLPHANKVLSNCNSNSAPFGCELQESDRCWSDVLKDRGYSLGYIGKWHLDAPYKPYVKCENNRPNFAWNEWCPPNRRHGFAFWYAYGTYDYHFTPMYWPTNAKRNEHVKVKQWGPEHEADLAIKYIRNEGGKYRKAGKPFALVMSMNPPHTPYNLVPKKYVDMYEGKTYKDLINRPNVDKEGDSRGGKIARNSIKNYFAMVTGVDDQFGRVLKALQELGLDKDTIVVFTSDHGNCLGSHEQPTKNVHYEESMRVPFIVRWLGKMGYSADIPKQVDGVSHASLFLTGKGKRPTSQLYMWVPVGKPASGRRGLRTDRYTFVISKTEGRPTEYTLHDNKNDPYQLNNIAQERPEIVKELTRELERLLQKDKDPWLRSEPSV